MPPDARPKMTRFTFPRFPGDMIIIPMILGILMNTFARPVLQMGGIFTAVVSNTLAIVGVFLFFLGATIDIKSLGRAAKTGTVILLTKLLLSVGFGFLVAFVFNDSFLGLSSLAIIGAGSVANNALYSAIMVEYGTDDEKGAVAITSLSVGPMVTMLALGSVGLASISAGAVVGSILPLLLGVLVAALNPGLRKILASGVPPCTIVLGFALGANMSLISLIEGGLSGVLLGLIISVLFGVITMFADRLTGGTGVAGIGISSVAASGIPNPAALAAVDPTYMAISAIATSQIAAAVIVTSFLTPILTGKVFKMNRMKKRD